MAEGESKPPIHKNEGHVQVPTLAGERSDEAPVLRVPYDKAADIANEIKLRNEERESLRIDVRFYIRERYHG